MIGGIEKCRGAWELPVSRIGINLRTVSYTMHISDANFEPGPAMIMPDGEVHLWRLDLDKVVVAESRWRTVISQDEITRADRFQFADDRQNFTATRALLRILLGSYMTRNPRQLSFLYGPNGKPSLGPSHGAEEVQFNVSHSGARALIAIARGRPLGVDIEQIRENVDCESLTRRYFSRCEQDALSALEASEHCRGFFRCWTRKESYIKARGAGLALPLHAFDVSVSQAEKNLLLATRPDASEAALWSICGIEVGAGYEAALCCKGRDWVLKAPWTGDFTQSTRR
jgi:4'-phosphopantetheinyl transferase